MIRKLLIVAIIVELGIAGFVFFGHNKQAVEDAPSKLINKQLLKESPTREVFDQSIDLKHGIDSTFQSETLNDIKSKYESQFLKLESSTYSKLVALAQNAANEYKQNEENTFTLLSDYLDEFKALEERTDNEFARLYKQFEQELQKNGFPITEAKEYKKAYEEKKESSMNELLQMITQ